MSRRIILHIVNSITFYRLAASPVLVVLIVMDEFGIFKWLLAVSFFTDLVDGTLARRFGVVSRFGARLDSIADDLTIVAGIIGLVVKEPGFLLDELVIISILAFLYVMHTAVSIWRYRRLSAFHVYTAKAAALMQGAFLLFTFFANQPSAALFYAAVLITAIGLIEEIVLMFLIRKWATDVKGLYWVLKEGKGVYF